MIKGLSSKEVQERINSNLVNNEIISYSRSVKSIILSNVITIFNIINSSLFILVLTTGSIQNSGFVFTIIFNTFIAIYQEIKAKIIIDKLKISKQLKVNVLRDGKEVCINKEEIVMDDIIVLKSGDEVLVDLIVVSDFCEVDESIITGESNSIKKQKDDKILSGTVIVSGNCLAKVVSINSDNYTNKLLKKASIIDENDSYLMNNINKILKIVTILLIPTGILLFLIQYFSADLGYNNAILSTVAGINGMIPEGLVLLTSISLTVSVIYLAKKNVVVQKLSGIENLACIDVLCLDKTGTITDNTLNVVKVINLEEDYSNVIANIVKQKINSTDIALSNYFELKEELNLTNIIPFSSQRKHTSVQIDNDTYKLGAFEFITNEKIEKYDEYILNYFNLGYRIITLVKNNKVKTFIILKDNLRMNAKDTIKYFEKQDVKIKIISGDNPKTVSNLLKQLEFDGYEKYIEGLNLPTNQEELEKIVDNYTIFGRITPDQKQQIVKSLKKNNKVGYVGDGVNDILALRESDCGITLKNAVSAARSASKIILTSDDFSILPDIVNEGRKVVNNIERVSSMYLIKTVFSFVLSLLSIILSYQYPFYPIQLSLISGVCVGIPSFFLALEPNYNKVKKHFMKKVFRNALPSAICVFINIFFIIMMIEIFSLDIDKLRIIIVSCTGLIYLRILYSISKPLTFIRKLLLTGCIITFFELLIFFPSFFLIEKFNIVSIVVIGIIYYFDTYIIDFLEELYDKLIMRGIKA